MQTKQILITAAIAAAVVLAMDFILPIKVDENFVGGRFNSKK